MRQYFGDEPAKAIAKILSTALRTPMGSPNRCNGIPFPTLGNIRLALEHLGIKVRHNLFKIVRS
jgi:hypothetical protein